MRIFSIFLRNNLRYIRSNVIMDSMVSEGEKIAHILKRLRLAKGYSQSHVANSLEVPMRTYQGWESKYASNIDNIVKICRFYSISPAEMFMSWASGYNLDDHFDTLVNSKHEASLSIVTDLFNGIGAEEIYRKYPNQFCSDSPSNHAVLRRIILDVYHNHPHHIPSLFPGFATELETAVSKAYSLAPGDVKVIDTGNIRVQLLKEILLAYPGAELLTQWTSEKPGFRLGISNGYIVPRILEQVKRGDIRNVKLFPMNFTNTAVDFPVSSSSVISAFLQKSEGYGISMDTSGEREVHSAMLLADAVIMGIGIFSPDSLYERMITTVMGKSAADEIRGAGIIGDLNYHLLDAEGNRVCLEKIVGSIGRTESDPLVKAIDLTELAEKAQRGCRNLVAAAGEAKAPVVKISLEQGYVNNLVIDSSLAAVLLDSL